jgi:two-component system, chemotaxis family, protein-glutamate methylesterase/glutaminase
MTMDEPLMKDAAPREGTAPEWALDVVVMAASAGGLKALSRILSLLPADFPGSILIVQHIDPTHRSLMAEILDRRTGLRVKQAEAGDTLEPGRVLIAPPNRHLILQENGTVALSAALPVNFLRPSADILFESVAAVCRERAVAVVLSGTGKDGASGVSAIKRMGGTVIAQSVATSEFSGMPESAIGTGYVDRILPLEEIADALVSLTSGSRD